MACNGRAVRSQVLRQVYCQSLSTLMLSSSQNSSAHPGFRGMDNGLDRQCNHFLSLSCSCVVVDGILYGMSCVRRKISQKSSPVSFESSFLAIEWILIVQVKEHHDIIFLDENE